MFAFLSGNYRTDSVWKTNKYDLVHLKKTIRLLILTNFKPLCRKVINVETSSTYAADYMSCLSQKSIPHIPLLLLLLL